MSAESDTAVEAETSAPAAVAPAAPALSPREAIEAWERASRQMVMLLRESAPDAAWLAQFNTAAEQMRTLARRDADTALYLLMQAAVTGLDRYSAHHAMLCAVVCELCAVGFEWPTEEVDALVRAALTMNLSMSATHDALARQFDPLSPEQREQVDGHAEQSAQRLTAAGVTDPLWTEVVRRHHEAATEGDGDAPPPAHRLAGLLHRVDIYTAKLSRRATREPTSPAIAARDACLDAAGQADTLGTMLLRTLGLYPPGCFVQMDNGEVGIVIRRGAKAHLPLVALLRRPDGALYLQPSRRDTALGGSGVAHGVNFDAVNVHLNPLRTLNAA